MFTRLFSDITETMLCN